MKNPDTALVIAILILLLGTSCYQVYRMETKFDKMETKFAGLARITIVPPCTVPPPPKQRQYL